MRKYFEDEQTRILSLILLSTLTGFILIPAGAMIGMLILDLANLPYSLEGVYIAVGLVCLGYLLMTVEAILTYRKLRHGAGT